MEFTAPNSNRYVVEQRGKRWLITIMTAKGTRTVAKTFFDKDSAEKHLKIIQAAHRS